MKNGIIYRITSPTNKVYIGKTFNLKRRIESYKGLYCKGQRILFNSLSKYGWDNHKFDILFEDHCDDGYLSKLECEYIIENDSFVGYNKMGMNLTLGGEGCAGLKHTEDTKKLISENRKKTGKTKAHQDAIDRLKGRKINKSDEWIKNNSESIKKSIIQYDLDGNLIKEWKSAKDVELELGFSRKNISANLRGITHKAYDFKWVYKGTDLVLTEKKKKGNRVIDIENHTIFNSVKEASDEIGISYSSLYQMLAGTIKNKTNLRYE